MGVVGRRGVGGWRKRRGGVNFAWSTDRGEPVLVLTSTNGSALGAHLLTFTARFGNDVRRWQVGPLYSDQPSASVPLLAPAEAWMSDVQADYVTDLVVVAEVEGVARHAPDSFLVPAGDGWEVVPREAMSERAPQGRLGEASRAPLAAEEGVELRVAAPASWPPARKRGSGAELDR